jgi:hypothetical protein
VGEVVSLTLIVWLQDAELPQSSLIVHFRVTTIGHDPVDTSIYFTDAIPQEFDVFPWLVASSNTASVDDAVVDEYGGSVTAPVLHPSMFRVCAQAVMTGLLVAGIT